MNIPKLTFPSNNDTFTFGMYKGKSVDMIIYINPKYVLWAEKNVSYFTLTPEQHDMCVKNIKDMYRSYSDKLELRERMYDDYDDVEGYSSDYEADMRCCFDPNY